MFVLYGIYDQRGYFWNFEGAISVSSEQVILNSFKNEATAFTRFTLYCDQAEEVAKKLYVEKGNKIKAIKEVRKLTGMSLQETKKFVEARGGPQQDFITF